MLLFSFSLPIPIPFLLLFALLPLPSSPVIPDPDDTLRFVLAAIPLCLSLPPPESGDNGSTVVQSQLRQALRAFEERRPERLESMSRKLCDAFGEYMSQELTERMVPRALHEGMGKEERWRRRMQGILGGIQQELNYGYLFNSFLGFLVHLNKFELKPSEVGIKVLPNKLLTMIFFDRLYGALQSLVEWAYSQQQKDDINRRNGKEEEEFALRWLKQMRKTISIRYEFEMAQLKRMFEAAKRELEKMAREEERSHSELKKQRKEANLKGMRTMEDSERRKAEGQRLLRELKVMDRDHEKLMGRIKEARECGARTVEGLNRLGGAGDPLDRVVREQVKLSLLNHSQAFLCSMLPRDTSDGSSEGCAQTQTIGDVSHQLVLSNFLKQNPVVGPDAPDGDSRDQLGQFLVHYGLIEIGQYLDEISKDTEQSWYGQSLMRTLRLIRPRLEAEMRTAWEYANQLGHFGHKFKESWIKINQIGALALYRHLYGTLVEQQRSGGQQNAQLSIGTFGPFMSPEEYTAYWLGQMIGGLNQKLARTKEWLVEQLRKDQRELERGGESMEIGESSREGKGMTRKLANKWIWKRMGCWIVERAAEMETKREMEEPLLDKSWEEGNGRRTVIETLIGLNRKLIEEMMVDRERGSGERVWGSRGKEADKKGHSYTM